MDELYLFDPGKGIPDTVAGWFEERPSDRRLRMMGCAYAESDSLRMAARIEQFFSQPANAALRPPGHWAAKPGDPLFWYGPAYAKALSNPDTPAEIESLDDVRNLPTSGATKKRNVFMTFFSVTPQPNASAVGRLRITAKWPGQTSPAPELDVAGLGNAEAAAYLRYHIVDVNNGGHAVTSAKELQIVQQSLQRNDFNEEQPRSAAVRHEWAVIGGEDRGGAFVGHLQMCLDGSRFA